jgi:SAM-dependent methyltransferase
LPQTDRQAALLFSHDAERMLATMAWFQKVVALLRPTSIVEVGCGAGFLLRFLHHAFPEIALTGIDRQPNLAALIPRDERLEVLTDDFLSTAPLKQHDLVLCDFGWDNHDIPRSVSPHSSAEIAGQSYCPGCSDDLVPHYRKMLSAWNAWATPNGSLACCGRLAGVGEIRAFVLAAESTGWHLLPNPTTILRVRSTTGNFEKYPALVFQAERADSVGSSIERLIRTYGDAKEAPAS